MRCPETWAKRRLAHSSTRLASFLKQAARASGEMLEVNGDIENVTGLLGVACTEMVTQLAAAMAIARDAQLRWRLGEFAAVDPGQEFLVGQIKNQSWLKVGGLSYTVDRKRG